MTAAQTLISDFLGDTVVRFYNTIEGTACVEYRECGLIRTATVVDMGRRILRHKRMLLADRVF